MQRSAYARRGLISHFFYLRNNDENLLRKLNRKAEGKEFDGLNPL